MAIREFTSSWELKPNKFLCVQANFASDGKCRVSFATSDYNEAWTEKDMEEQPFDSEEVRNRIFVENFPLILQGLGTCQGLLEAQRLARGRELPPVKTVVDQAVAGCLQNFMGFHGCFRWADRESLGGVMEVNFTAMPVIHEPSGTVATTMFSLAHPGRYLVERKPIQAMRKALFVMVTELKAIHRELAPPPPKEIKTWLDHWT